MAVRIHPFRLNFGTVLCLVGMFLGEPYAYVPSNILLPPSSFRLSPLDATTVNSNNGINTKGRYVPSSVARMMPFTSTTPTSSHVALYASPTTLDVQDGEESGFLDTNLLLPINGENLDSQSMTPSKASSKPWIFLFACFIISRLVGGGNNLLSSSRQPSLLLEAGVSSTFLRRKPTIFPTSYDRKGGNRLTQLLSLKNLTSVLFLWQTSQILFKSVLPFTLKSISRFISWYLVRLEVAPLVTSVLTTAVIGLIGDCGAQYFEGKIQRKKQNEVVDASSQAFHSTSSSSTTRKQSPFKEFIKNYDSRRGLANVGDSFLLSGPLLFFAYRWMEHLLPVVSATSGMAATTAALGHVLIDDFILDGIFIAMMFITTGVAEGLNLREISVNLKNDLFPAIRASVCASLLLLPIEFSCFRFLPPALRVIAMNVIDIFWNAMISFIAHRSRHKTTPSEVVVDNANINVNEDVAMEVALSPM